MSRESLFSLLDGMKNRMTCLETKAKQEETDIDTLKQNMDKIESKLILRIYTHIYVYI